MKIDGSTHACTRRLLSGTTMVLALTVLMANDASAQNWTLTLGAGEAYDSNTALAGSTETGSLSTNVLAGVGRNVPFRGGGLNFAANASQVFYRDNTPLNNLNYSLVGGFTLAVTRRLSWSASDSLISSYSRDSKILTDSGLFLPTVVTRTNARSTQLTYALTQRTQVHWGLSEQSVVFGSPDLLGGAHLTSIIGLSRRMSPSQTLR